MTPQLHVVAKHSLDFPAEQVFTLLTRHGAFERLAPPWKKFSICGDVPLPSEIGSQLTLKGKLAGFSSTATYEHVSFNREKMTFVDRQIKGPFSHWEHTHRVVPISDASCSLEDEITFSIPFLSSMVQRELGTLFDYRHFTLQKDLELFSSLPQTPLRILISGSSGMIGNALTSFLRYAGCEVVPLIRSKTQKGIYWDPRAKKANVSDFEGFDAVIHLAGANIASQRWSKQRKEVLWSSRVETTRYLSELLLSLSSPPKTVITVSAVGYYGNCSEPVDETASKGKGFLADLCKAWEDATIPLEEKGIRVVHPRFGMVLTPSGGTLARLLPLFCLGLGGKLGNGEQKMSWIALDDLLGGIYHILRKEQLTGPVNFTAPQSVSNKEFTKALAQRLGRPALFAVPKSILHFALGEMADELLFSSCSALPKTLLQTGYRFRYDRLEDCLHYLNAKSNKRG